MGLLKVLLLRRAPCTPFYVFNILGRPAEQEVLKNYYRVQCRNCRLHHYHSRGWRLSCYQEREASCYRILRRLYSRLFRSPPYIYSGGSVSAMLGYDTAKRSGGRGGYSRFSWWIYSTPQVSNQSGARGLSIPLENYVHCLKYIKTPPNPDSPPSL